MIHPHFQNSSRHQACLIASVVDAEHSLRRSIGLKINSPSFFSDKAMVLSILGVL